MWFALLPFEENIRSLLSRRNHKHKHAWPWWQTWYPLKSPTQWLCSRLLIQRLGPEPTSLCSRDVSNPVSNWNHLLSLWLHWSHGRSYGDQMVRRWWQATPESLFSSMWFCFSCLSYPADRWDSSSFALAIRILFIAFDLQYSCCRLNQCEFPSLHTSLTVATIDPTGSVVLYTIDRLVWPQKIMLWF